MRRLIVLTFALALPAQTSAQQSIRDNMDDHRIEVLNAVFAFRNDLGSDSTRIARCRIPTANPDSGVVPGLEARFQALLVRPKALQRDTTGGCAVSRFADRKRVLWLQDLIEIRKTPSTGFLPEFRRKQFEVTFQLLVGSGYREFQQYVVEPSGITRAPNGNMVIAGWRVVEYKLVGWEFDWATGFGGGVGVRP